MASLQSEHSANVFAAMLVATVKGMRSLGLDTGALLVEVGIPDPERTPIDTAIPYSKIAALWDCAVRASGDQTLGLRVAERLDSDAFSLLLYLGRSSTGFSETLADVHRFADLIGEGISFRLRKLGERDMLVHRLAGDTVVHPASSDFVLATVVTMIRRELSPDFIPAEIHFARQQPRETAPYEAFFGSRIVFDADENAIVFHDLAALVPPQPDAALHKILERSAEQLLAERRAEPAFERDLRGAIAERLGHGKPTARGLAAGFGMSDRTLRRRLAKRGISLSSLLDEVRFQLAEQYLAGGIEVKDTAARLGFSEPSAFYRAFRRWTGTTPGRHRDNSVRAS